MDEINEDNDRVPDRLIADKDIIHLRQKAYIPDFKPHDFNVHASSLDLQDRIPVEMQEFVFDKDLIYKEDWLTFLLKPAKNNCSNLTRLGMTVNCQDSMIIASYPDLRDACLSDITPLP